MHPSRRTRRSSLQHDCTVTYRPVAQCCTHTVGNNWAPSEGQSSAIAELGRIRLNGTVLAYAVRSSISTNPFDVRCCSTAAIRGRCRHHNEHEPPTRSSLRNSASATGLLTRMACGRSSPSPSPSNNGTRCAPGFSAPAVLARRDRSRGQHMRN